MEVAEPAHGRHRSESPSSLRTGLRDLLGIEHPIVQAPIGSATTPELAAAVSNAGALGSLALTWRSRREVEEILARTKRLTGRPFAANLVLAWPQGERVEIVLDAGARIIWTFWGDPQPYVATVHRSDGIVLHTVGSPEEARNAADAGVDVIVLQGVEAGGHVRGTLPLRELLARVRDEMPDAILVAAGGLADGGEVAAVITAGADGACLGTRFLCSHQAGVAPVYQTAILEAGVGDTLLTGLFDKGWPDAPHRVLRNSTVRMWEAAGRPAPGGRPGEGEVVATTADGTPVERYSDIIPTRGLVGDLEALALYAGKSSARICDVLPAGEIVRRLVAELPGDGSS
jgi:nitronate monooxygenase